MINTENYFYSVTLHTKSMYFVSYRVNQQDPDDSFWEELSFFLMMNPKVILKVLFVSYHLVQSLVVMREVV